jgi:DNA-nicking Smr family endonuclease
MAKKKYSTRKLNRVCSLRENKKLPRLPLDTDPSALFTAGDPSGRHEKFVDAVEHTLAATMLTSILREKEKSAKGPKGVGERIKSFPPPQAKLDLHGLTAKEATVAAGDFITGAIERRLNTVRVITGKGLHSQGEPVLREIIEEKLLEWKAEGLVLAFQWERQHKLRSGSVIVYLGPLTK